MRFDPNRPDLLTDIEWFFCQPGAKVYPGYHRFASTNWEDGIGQNDQSLGEIKEPLPRRVAGIPPPIATGQAPCGGPRKFQEGVNLVNGPIVARDSYGIPACCYPGGVIPPSNCLLMEDAGYIRLESGDRIELE